MSATLHHGHAVDAGAMPASGSVDIWRVALDRDAAVIAQQRYLLSQDEAARADQFRFEPNRRCFIAAHATLHVLLARYLDKSPTQIEFTYNEHGKPALATSALLEFNHSYSENLGLITIASERQVGVDIERVRDGIDMDAIAKMIFSLTERKNWRRQPHIEKPKSFLKCGPKAKRFPKPTERRSILSARIPRAGICNR